ncbi:hypothetical protein K6L09_32885 [Burkholderia cepacia]
MTSFIVGTTHSCPNAFWVAGAVIVMGFASIAFVLGRIEPHTEIKASAAYACDLLT